MKLSAILALMFAQGASAATLGTATLPSSGNDLVTWNTWKAQSFTMSDITVPSIIESVSLSLEVVVPNANFVVRVVGSTGTPGRPNMTDIRAELRPTAPLAGTAVTLLSFESDPAATFPALQPDATYWLIAGMTAADFDESSPAGIVRWYYTGTHGQSPGAQDGWKVGGMVASSDTEGGDWAPVNETPFLFTITAIPVIPEPGSCGLLLSTAVFFLRRRRP